MKLKISLIICLFVSAFAVAQEGPLESLLSVYRVVSEVGADGQAEETLVETEEALPGETLEYVLTYSNNGDQALQGFVIKNRIPENTIYLGESNSSDIASDFLVSIDYGITWEDVPVTRVVTDSTGAERTVVIPPEQYTNVSWQVNGDLAPQEDFELRYRVEIL